MSDVVVRPVTSRAEQKAFLALPWSQYRDDPNWIPPIRVNQKELVGYKPHPFYHRNEVQTFLAYCGGEVCGRVAAILNRDHNDRYQEKRGFFGFFECVDRQPVADALLGAVRAWFADRGIHALRGPTNPSLNYELGLLIDGFDSPPTFMMTYNPPYYARLIEKAGYRKTQDLFAYWGHVDMLPVIHERLGPIAQQIIERYDVKLRPLDRKHFHDDVRLFLDIYNKSLTNTWGFVPMSDAEIRHTARALRYLMVPELALTAEIDGRAVGAVFGLPDYNPRIKQIDGRLFPFGFIRLLSKKHKMKRIRLISTNVLPEYQRYGIGLVLMGGLVPMIIKSGIEEAEFSWVLESNALSRGSLEKGGAQLFKTYRLYDLAEEPRPALPPARPVVSHASSASPVEIRQVQSRRDLNRFVRLPWRIYEKDPQWVPPLLVAEKEFLNPKKHPFYCHGAATQFLALRDGQPVGRILASDDPNYNQQHGGNVGCFGMFECLEDPAAAHALLDAAAGWLRARGRSTLMGPIDYSTNYPCGLLIEGFDTPPRILMNHHRPYYAALLESWGLAKVKDLYSWWFTDPNNMLAQWRSRVERIAQRSKIRVRPFRKDHFDDDVDRCRTIYNTARTQNWGFVRVSDAEFRYLARQLAEMALAELVLLAEVDDRPVGFSITLPDLNEAIRPLDGRLTTFGIPVGLARLMYRKRHIKTARMLILDVVEDYRRRGVAELLILRTMEHGRTTIGYTGAELGWTLEDNYLINRTVEAVGAKHYKTYRIYQKELAE